MSLPEGLSLSPTLTRYEYALQIRDAQDVVWVEFPQEKDFRHREDPIEWIEEVVTKTALALNVMDVFDDEADHLTENGDEAIIRAFVREYYGEEEDDPEEQIDCPECNGSGDDGGEEGTCDFCHSDGTIAAGRLKD